jgi:hypothetical protein
MRFLMIAPRGSAEPKNSAVAAQLPALSADEAKLARLEFLRVMLTEMKQLSDGIGERTLSYLVGMAALEAAESVKVHKYRTELHGK